MSSLHAPRQPSWPARLFTPLLTLLAALVLLVPLPAALALSIDSFPDQAPEERVVDTAGILSRAALADISRQLEAFGPERVNAHLVTVKQLDYGLSLPDLGRGLLARWETAAEGDSQAPTAQLLFLIDSQTNSAAVVASSALDGRLSPDLLRSTARTTMALPIRDGARFRQASLDGSGRLLTVLRGGEDPGEPVVAPVVTAPSNVPSREETASSNALTWVVVLLVVGTIVPMATWWVFSR